MLSYNGSAKFWNVIRSIRKLVQTENEQTVEKKNQKQMVLLRRNDWMGLSQTINIAIDFCTRTATY